MQVNHGLYCMWQCDPVIHYTSAFAGVHEVELIKSSDALELCRAPAIPCLPSPEVHLAAHSTHTQQQGHFIECQKEVMQMIICPKLKC